MVSLYIRFLLYAIELFDLFEVLSDTLTMLAGHDSPSLASTLILYKLI